MSYYVLLLMLYQMVLSNVILRFIKLSYITTYYTVFYFILENRFRIMSYCLIQYYVLLYDMSPYSIELLCYARLY